MIAVCLPACMLGHGNKRAVEWPGFIYRPYEYFTLQIGECRLSHHSVLFFLSSFSSFRALPYTIPNVLNINHSALVGRVEPLLLSPAFGESKAGL